MRSKMGKVVLYVSSETFTNEMINAIRYRTNEEFLRQVPLGGRVAGGRHPVHRRQGLDRGRTGLDRPRWRRTARSAVPSRARWRVRFPAPVNLPTLTLERRRCPGRRRDGPRPWPIRSRPSRTTMRVHCVTSSTIIDARAQGLSTRKKRSSRAAELDPEHRGEREHEAGPHGRACE